MAEVAAGLKGVSASLGSQAVSTLIPPFDGTPGKFGQWIKALEKFFLLHGPDDHSKKLAAFQSATGAVSDFIHRFLEKKAGPWAELKTELITRFGEPQDPQHAFASLKTLKQFKGEHIQLFAERLLAKAERAFPEPGTLAAMQPHLVGFFTDGLTSDVLKLKMMRENPRSIQQAVEIACAEQTVQELFARRYPSSGLLREETAMEVDAARRPLVCYKCKKPGHKAVSCKVVSAVQKTEETSQEHCRCCKCAPAKRAGPKQETRSCFMCGEKGHIRPNCPLRLQEN